MKGLNFRDSQTEFFELDIWFEINFLNSEDAILLILGFIWTHFCIIFIGKCINFHYRPGQENADWLKNVSLIKNPHFRWYQADILTIWSNHEVGILNKFHRNWIKIDNFSLIAHFLASTHSPAQVCTGYIHKFSMAFTHF